MKDTFRFVFPFRHLLFVFAACLLVPTLKADPAVTLFQDDFTGDIPGWTLVQPAGAYIDGPMLWQFDKVSNSFRENSNVYTDNATASTSRRAVMLISDAVVPANFEYTARLTTGDNDGFGLIWGYENETNFYRAEFAQQTNPVRTGWPYTGWSVDRMSNAVPVDISVNAVPFSCTVNQPFDVKIAVTNGVLTLTVDDDPLGTVGGPFHYDLVVAQPLPSTASGRVGIFSWGQQGGNPAAFRIQSPTLNGTALDTAAINNVLTNDWSFTITPSSGNDYPVDTGTWGFGKTANGPLGMMIENNDSAPENTAASSTNTPVNAAVIGDLNWSNYVVSVRFVTPDDDGFGVMLRYQDRTNWYRIGFRAQNSQAGIKQGISVQKNVNRTFDQMLSSTAFIPPINAPFDVHAAIRDNSLQIMCVVNPDGASPTISSFGPINMAASALVPGNLATGKAGVFSWAQRSATTDDYGTGVDSFRVRKVDNEGLLVSSSFGTPDPPAGLNDLPISGLVTAKVDNVVVTAPGVRQVSAGWSGAGSVPGTGATNEVIFTLTQFSLLTWKWQTQYLLTANTSPGGIVVAAGGPWHNSGSNATVNAIANAGYVFTGWTGDSVSTSPTLLLSMTRPATITAHFAVDSDSDGLPDTWEQQYFGNLGQSGGEDADSDAVSNLAEYQLGTNPNFPETPVFADGISSRWINETRDRALPGWFVVTNFGTGFRGLWETSNHNRFANGAGPDDAPFISATSYATNASFQGPAIIVRPNVWDTNWETTFSLSAEYSVGDNDGLCMYFRYLNRSNWYRVTICGDDGAAPTRPLKGLSIQKRTNGWFSAITPTTESGFDVFNDELDTTGFKRIRITVNATNNNFEVRAIGWNVLLPTPDWDPAYERILTFTDADLPAGRIGIGPWGMGGGKLAWSATNGNPVGAGLFIDNIVVKVDGTNALVEDWETATQHTDFPAGWENPYAGYPVGGLLGDWHVSAHATIANFNFPFGTPQTGTIEFPRADGEGPVFLAPQLTNANYVLQLGIHPLDDGGMGFVYDFKDTNNYARVLFDSQVPGAGQLPQGLNISRKSNGVWSDIVVGDNTFVYTPGRPFDVRFANNNGAYTLTASLTDDPATVYHWSWTDQATAISNRVGFAIWDMPDAHYTYLRASALPSLVSTEPLKITGISLSGGNVILDISKPAGSSYHVLRAPSVTGPYVTNAANQTGAQYSEPAPAGSSFYRLQLAP
jgi:uncharacterized repeat protein (TIGR02543 family)